MDCVQGNCTQIAIWQDGDGCTYAVWGRGEMPLTVYTQLFPIACCLRNSVRHAGELHCVYSRGQRAMPQHAKIVLFQCVSGNYKLEVHCTIYWTVPTFVKHSIKSDFWRSKLSWINKKLIRRWDSERELFYDDIVHEFDEITQNKGHYTVQGHSRSPILVAIESSYNLLICA